MSGRTQGRSPGGAASTGVGLEVPAGGVDGGGELGGEGAEAGEAGFGEAVDQGGADDGAVGEAGDGGGLVGGGDADAGADGEVGVGADPADQLLDPGREGGSQAGHAQGRLGVDESPSGLGDRGQAGVARGGGGQEHGGDPGGAGRLQPLPRLLGGQVGHDRPAGAGGGQLGREPPWAAVGDQVVVDEQDHRGVDAGGQLVDQAEDVVEPGPGVEGGGDRPLDDRPVDQRVRVGRADLEHVGPGLGHGPERGQRPVQVREPGDPVGDQRRPLLPPQRVQPPLQPLHRRRRPRRVIRPGPGEGRTSPGPEGRPGVRGPTGGGGAGTSRPLRWGPVGCRGRPGGWRRSRRPCRRGRRG